jgi:hypothetical protein
MAAEEEEDNGIGKDDGKDYKSDNNNELATSNNQPSYWQSAMDERSSGGG